MSWFDHLFGEADNDPSSQRSKRRRQNKDERFHDTSDFVQQSHDIYQRPRGKFRFPIDMHDEAVMSNHETNGNPKNMNTSSWTPHHGVNAHEERRHRRHRGVQRAHFQAQQHGDLSSSTEASFGHDTSYSSSQRKKHSKLQMETPTKVNYHQKPFKASEVPSAIFGTRQPKEIENSGLNQPPGTRKSIRSGQTDTTSTQTNKVQDSTDQSQKQRQEPSKTRRPKTVNLENFYASQIVEEIRREREKKVMQKKNFKEALKKKRAAHTHQQNSDIQKAIDEMYSAQAKQLLGDQYDEVEKDRDEVSLETTNDSSEQSQTTTDTNLSTPEYEYEEVDLTQVDTTDKVHEHDVEQYSNEDVQPSSEYDDEEENEVTDELTEIDEEAVPSHENRAASFEENEVSTPKVQSENDELEIDEAVYTEKVQAEEAQSSQSEADDAENGEHAENHLLSHRTSEVSDEADEMDETSTASHSEGNVESRKLEPTLKPEIKKSTTPSKHETSQAQVQDVTAKNEDKNTQQPSVMKTPIRKGSKPFNVVMTPSDKKRMMSRQKAQQSSSATEQTIERSSETTPSTQNEQTNSAVETHQEGQVTQPAKKEGHTIRRGPNLTLPSVDLLDMPEQHEQDDTWIAEKKEELNNAFYYFNVPAEVVNVVEGPSVTRFELSVERGVKVSRITALQDDIKMALAAKDIRIEAPIPGTSLVGIEVPNQQTTKVNIRSIIDSPAFKQAESKLTVAMGNRINNAPLLMDIAKTPHALIAGATGSGKSVSINSILLSLLYRNHPEELRLLLIDPKMVELAPYNGLPHLVAPVITDVKAATQSLKWAVDEMERRFKLFAHHHVRNISAFNNKVSYDQRIPKIVIVIDELADLMMMAPQDVEQSIARLAQKARACGIHMLVATQRPSVNVITGLIKANIPTRIAFMVSSSVDSRTILDSGGAERLLGYGDMLYLGSGMNKPIRVQGTFVSDDEIDQVVDFIRSQREPEYLFQEKELLEKTEAPSKDELFDDVCAFMVREQHISTSLIQRHFQIGYNRAARIIDQLEQLGYISGANGSKPRDVYLTEAELNDH